MEKGKCRIKNVDSQLRYCPRPLEGRGHVTLARGDSNTLRLRRAPLHSGFSRKSREKRHEFRAGLYCNVYPLFAPRPCFASRPVSPRFFLRRDRFWDTEFSYY